MHFVQFPGKILTLHQKWVFCKYIVISQCWKWHSVLTLEIAPLDQGGRQTNILHQGKTSSPRLSSNFSRFCRKCDLIKRFLLPTNISNRDIAVGQLNIIMYPAYVVLCVFDYFKYDELCERKSFSHWLRSLSFGDQRARPISNSQGYFQLMIIFCHLDSAAAPGQFLIIANQRRNLAMKEQKKLKSKK